MNVNRYRWSIVHAVQAGAAIFVLLGCLLQAAPGQPVAPVRPEDFERHSKPIEPEHRADPAKFPAPEIPDSADDTALTDKPLKGIRFVAVPADVVQTADVTGIEIKDIELLDNDEFRGLIEPYLGKSLSWRRIYELVRETILYYRSKDRPMVDVSPPADQDVTDGVLQLLVIEARVGEVKVEGLHWFSPELIRDQVRLQSGDRIEAKKLLEDIDHINNNPFRFVRPVLSPGKEFGATDLIIDAKDRFPVRFYGGYDDTGSRATGLERFFVGANLGNVWGLGHEAGYQYTTNKHPDDLGIHSAYYRIPLPNRDTLAFFGNFSAYNTSDGGKLDSNNWMAHVRYISALPGGPNLRHEIEFGLDFRRMDNELKRDEVKVYDDYVDVAQLAFQYGGRARDRWGDTSWTMNLYGAPCPDMLSGHQDDKHYRAARGGAEATYIYSHANIERLWVLPADWSFFNRFSAQASSDRLIPSEQMGLGGYNRVRGYDDFEVLADNGLMGTAELRTPEWSLGKLDAEGKCEHFLQFLTFVDWGWARNRGHYRDADPFRSTDMLSFGPGMRYRINHNLEFRFDYGWQLERIPDGNNDHGRCHVSLIISY